MINTVLFVAAMYVCVPNFGCVPFIDSQETHRTLAVCNVYNRDQMKQFLAVAPKGTTVVGACVQFDIPTRGIKG